MSRLIDADKLIEDIRKLANEIYNIDTMRGLSSVLDLVVKQPTAYKLDKVVEYLEELKMINQVRSDHYLKQGYKEAAKKYLLKVNAYDRAIEIVKRGEIDE